MAEILIENTKYDINQKKCLFFRITPIEMVDSIVTMAIMCGIFMRRKD